MKYLYDSERDALTIQLADRKYADSEEVWPGVVVDFDTSGRPIAFDFTEGASKHVDVKGLEPGAWRRVSSPIARKPASAITPAELRRRREWLGLTQAQLGTLLGTPANTIARWERGELRIEKPQLVALAMAQIAEGRESQPVSAKVKRVATSVKTRRARGGSGAE